MMPSCEYKQLRRKGYRSTKGKVAAAMTRKTLTAKDGTLYSQDFIQEACVEDTSATPGSHSRYYSPANVHKPDVISLCLSLITDVGTQPSQYHSSLIHQKHAEWQMDFPKREMSCVQ
ncbi:uncharacterized protein LOC121820977 [Peromyscus maniculatus bairdii]|uniref:uncharacterized protein LOC121820977 n=1 Tax=Peromyscus maniculatus bairdii TaxID=230844 RepID=UPI003FD6164F